MSDRIGLYIFLFWGYGLAIVNLLDMLSKK